MPGTAVKGSVAHFHSSVEREEKETAEKKHTKTPRDIRDELCSKKPPDPACTADGHASRATEFEKLFRPLAPDQFALAAGVFIDKAIPKRFGAYVQDCRAFKPKLPGDQCIFIPERLEKQAASYNSGEKKIGSEDREEWLTKIFGRAIHELEHVRFEQEFLETKPRRQACDFDDISAELTELAAIMSEFPVFFRAYASKSWHDRRVEMNQWFSRNITQPSRHGQRISGILKAIRCRCECRDVNAYLERLVEFTTKSWTEVEKNTFHEELRDPKWKLDWPIQTPPPPRDIPSWMIEPTIGFGYGTFGKGGPYLSLSLDLGIPLNGTGKWQLLLGAQGRFFPGLTPDERNAYLLGLKVGFLRGPTLGYRGWQAGVFAEIGKGRLVSGGETEKGGYAGGGLSLRYTPGLEKESALIPFIGVDIGGGAMFDTSKPVLRKLFFVGLTAGIEF